MSKMNANSKGIEDIINILNNMLDSKIVKSSDQALRDFRRYKLKDKNMEKNSYEYMRSINWYQTEINKKLLKIYNLENVNDNTKELTSLIVRLDCTIEQFLRHRELWHKDSADFKDILRESYCKILSKCKEVIDIPSFLEHNND